MHIVILAFLTAISYWVLLRKILGVPRMIRWDKWLDAFFTLLVPIPFFGTFSGMATAVLAGLFLSAMLALMRWLMGDPDQTAL